MPPKDVQCIACGGKGIASRGGVCVACFGTGVKQAPQAMVVESNFVRSKKIKKCPSGYKFGITPNVFDACKSCNVQNECIAQKEIYKKRK